MSDDWNNIQDFDFESIFLLFKSKIKDIEIDNYDKIESRIWQQYLAYLPNMDDKKFIKYSDFLRKHNIKHPLALENETKKDVKIKSKNDILDKAALINSNDRKRREILKNGTL